jgi:hypothetical protein
LEVGGLVLVADGNALEAKDCGRSWLASANGDAASVTAIGAAAIAWGFIDSSRAVRNR